MRPAPRLVLTTLLLAHGCESARPIGAGTPGPAPDGGPTQNPGGAQGFLAVGDFDRAHGAFVSGSAPADDAGACLTRILRLTESAGATSVMGAFGWPRLPAHDLLGPDSVPGRAGKRWNGTAEVTLPSRTTALPRARVDVSGRAVAIDLSSATRADVVGLPSPGSSVHGTVDCTTGTVVYPGVTFASFTQDGEYCGLTTNVRAGPGCSTDAGDISVSSARLGEAVEVRLDDVLLDCGAADPVRASMRFEARLSDATADAAGLHPMLREDDFGHMLSLARSGVTLGQLVTMLQSWVPELSTAADECARAADAGVTFRVPGVLWSGDDLSATPGDLSMVAGFADVAAGAILIAGAFDASLELQPLCMANACVSTTEFAARLNAAVGGLTSGAAITRAQPLVTTGLDRLARGLSRLDASSAFARETGSASDIDEARRWIEELHRSMGGAAVTLTDFAPAVRVDASRFFTMPPNPDNIPADPVVVQDDQIVLVEAFFDAFFGAAIDVDWTNGSYSAPSIGGVFDVLRDRMRSRGWLLAR